MITKKDIQAAVLKEFGSVANYLDVMDKVVTQGRYGDYDAAYGDMEDAVYEDYDVVYEVMEIEEENQEETADESVEMIIKCNVDSTSYNDKPQGKEVGAVQKRIASGGREITIKELANVLSHGGSFKSAYLSSNNNDSFISQQLLVLDFDDGFTHKDFMNRCEALNLTPSFTYHSFSNMKDKGNGAKERFRAVFTLRDEITDLRVRLALQTAIMTIFPESDLACKDISRLYFGGTDLIMTDYSAVVYPEYLLKEALPSYLKLNDKNNHYNRDIKKFAESVGLNLKNGVPDVDVQEENEISSLLAQTPQTLYIYYRTCAQNAKSDSKVIYNFNIIEPLKITKSQRGNIKVQKAKITASTEHTELIRNFDFEKLKLNCSLFSRFIDGKHWPTYQTLKGIATNLWRYEGGAAKMTAALEKYTSYYNNEYKRINDLNLITNMSNYQYEPMRCENYCPFAADCKRNGVNMLHQVENKRGSIRKVEDIMTRPVEEVSAELRIELRRVYESDDNKIYLIKAPTGVGKTAAYTSELDLHNTCIAVPTHKLGGEVFNKLKVESNAPINRSYTHEEFIQIGKQRHKNFTFIRDLVLNDDFQKQHLHQLYSLGLHGEAKKYLQDLVKYYKQKHKESGRAASIHQIQAINIQKYLDSVRDIDKAANVLVTHQRMINLKNNNINTYIVDEDIIPSILKVVELDISTLNVLIANSEGEVHEHLAAFKNDIINNPIGKVSRTPKYMINEKQLNKVIKAAANDIKCDIKDILASHTFVHTTDENNNDKYTFIVSKASKIRPDKKYIIMSATASETIYKSLFGDRLEVIDLGAVKQQGSLNLHYNRHSFSKNSLNKHWTKDIEYIKQHIDNNINVITFKSFQDKFKKEGFTNFIANFGATSGIDEYKGQDLAVIGTYHFNNEVYYLYASVLGLDLNFDDFYIKPSEIYQVRRNGYEFSFNTFDNPLLQEIQFYLIESEMLQAIGRARTTWFDCNVHLFSNLPLEQFELVK